MSSPQEQYAPLKRAMDIVVSLFLIIIFMPVWIIIPILITIDSRGPIIFRHKRLGKNGKQFNMLKFRSMVKDAHFLLHQQDKGLLEKFKEADWKLENDPRITRVGKILRSLTIDEFPQLLNVLKGEMSMVGPRAYMKQEIKEQTTRYPETKKDIKTAMKVKPGITGPWQVSGRNEIPFKKRAKLDATYAKNHSFWDDIKIILKTPTAMLSRW